MFDFDHINSLADFFLFGYSGIMNAKQTARRAFMAVGQVQGVGFRPFVYRLAREGGLTGTVGNTSDGVRMEVQGPPEEVERFDRRLRAELPPLARLVGLNEQELAPLSGETAFTIVSSHGHAGHSVLVSPDMGICPDCLADMCDPANRRHGYPFTNCTNCGPRYTITRAIPYDRGTTTMSCFPLCPDCAAEYADPGDRRFHAQPIACPACGPRLWFVDRRVARSGDTGPTRDNQREALARAGQLLLDGGILALKGLGGFQLACDARDAGALQELRRRKIRPHKPLALMVADPATARAFCELTPEHEALLQSPEKPIVLCPRRAAPAGTEGALPPEVAPDARTVGLMLPYTPLHAALFHWLVPRAALPPALVMTSANPHGEPLCLDNREALARLGHLADAWLLHDRDILVRVDDSVLTVAPHPPQLGYAVDRTVPAAAVPPAVEPLFFRRARGYVPRPVFLPPPDGGATGREAPDPTVLGAGANLKSTICLTRGREAFVGQHIGDLENPATLGFYEEVAAHLEQLLEVRPKALVCDLHPDFLSTRYAEARAAREGLPLWRLQHHAAHAASVLADNDCYQPALALCLDGTGLGDDGTIWGGELLWMDLSRPVWKRLGRLSPFALPGGEAAIREPWRTALALQLHGGEERPAPWDSEYASAAVAVREMLARGLNCPSTSSCGRLFDAVAAQLGLCLATTYEGQAAIRLEAATDEAALRDNTAWSLPPAEKDGLLEVDSATLFRYVLRAQAAGEPTGRIAAYFHGALARALAAMAAEAARATGACRVGLSGGVMQNALLARLLPQALAEHGLSPLMHHELPPGDGGLSLGQAVWGRQALRRGHYRAASAQGEH